MYYTKDAIEKKRRRKLKRKKIFTFFVYIIVLPIIVYNISLIIVSMVNKSETPSFFGIKAYVIVSGSMQPELNIGDIVIVKKQKSDKIQVGDIISFREGETIITHRIIEINEKDGEKQFITKGDYNNAKDSNAVKYESVEGVCINKIPYLGNIVLFLKKKIVIISIVLIFYLIYSHDVKVSEKEKVRRKKRREYERKLNSYKEEQ